MTTGEKIPCSVEDHLDVDEPIPGQRFVCLSFLPPETVLERRDVFEFGKFMDSRCAKLREMLDELSTLGPECERLSKAFAERHALWLDPGKTAEEFAAFRSGNYDALNIEFSEKETAHTSVRGLKVRGSYGTEKEARSHADGLRAGDPNFNVYVATVGAWLPWDPSEDTMGDVEYQETELNTLMKKYRENRDAHSKHYAENTATKVAAAIADGKAAVVTDAAGPSRLPTEIFEKD